MTQHVVPRALLVLLLASCASCGSGAQHARPRYAEREEARAPAQARAPDPELDAYRDRPAVVVLEGQASYYSDSLAGNETANGESYELDRFTAASRDLPFGSVVRVVRRDTGASVMVRINDRGPFGSKKRILDLSRAAAEALHMIGRGVAPVRAEVVHLGQAQPKRR